MLPSALLVLNRSAGTGHAEAEADRIAGALRAGHAGGLEVEVAVVDDHAAARSRAGRSDAGLVVAAGGGGTLRAVVEGVMDALGGRPFAEAPRLAALRMGSGNVIARRLGVPLDPVEGARQVGEGFARGRTVRCPMLRCTHGSEGGGEVVRHATTMCGLGAWGRVPGDIARWRQRHVLGRRRSASWIGLERVNTGEYLGFGAVRMLAATVSATRCELVQIDDSRPSRLLAGVALTVPLPPLPPPGFTIVPRFGRPIRRPLEVGAGLSLRLLDRESVAFFLDEDPEVAHDWLRLEVPGRLAFVSGAQP